MNGDVEDQPVDDGSKGELVIGPGAGGMQPRPSEVKRALPPLTYQQEEMLKKAKRFAMEQSVQQVGGRRPCGVLLSISSFIQVCWTSRQHPRCKDLSCQYHVL